jgi:hypothetical protein
MDPFRRKLEKHLRRAKRLTKHKTAEARRDAKAKAKVASGEDTFIDGDFETGGYRWVQDILNSKQPPDGPRPCEYDEDKLNEWFQTAGQLYGHGSYCEHQINGIVQRLDEIGADYVLCVTKTTIHPPVFSKELPHYVPPGGYPDHDIDLLSTFVVTTKPLCFGQPCRENHTQAVWGYMQLIGRERFRGKLILSPRLQTLCSRPSKKD